jgi:hypothetical protein
MIPVGSCKQFSWKVWLAPFFLLERRANQQQLNCWLTRQINVQYGTSWRAKRKVDSTFGLYLEHLSTKIQGNDWYESLVPSRGNKMSTFIGSFLSGSCWCRQSTLLGRRLVDKKETIVFCQSLLLFYGILYWIACCTSSTSRNISETLFYPWSWSHRLSRTLVTLRSRIDKMLRTSELVWSKTGVWRRSVSLVKVVGQSSQRSKIFGLFDRSSCILPGMTRTQRKRTHPSSQHEYSQ